MYVFTNRLFSYILTVYIDILQSFIAFSKQVNTLSVQSKPSVRSRLLPSEQRLIVKGDERSGASQEPLAMRVSWVGFEGLTA